ncbi:MAG TPA: hypothetical protein VL123_09565 [Candidatus Udaeobacter sp.]|nr:hypothetical protein [Candidatus Udaeobacter sp.]
MRGRVAGSSPGGRGAGGLIPQVAVILGSLLLALTALPAAAVPRYTTAYVPDVPDPPRQGAQLVLTREQFVRINRLKPEEISLDGEPIGVLPQKTWLLADIAPGRHCLHGLVEGDDLWFDARDGRRYLLRLRETIDEGDHLRQAWLFDDPRMAGRIVREGHLPMVRTTADGLRRIRKHMHPVESQDPLAIEPRGKATFPGILLERPLDPVNIRHEFADEPGTLVVESDEIRYAAPHEHVVIPLADVIRVRYGGTRYSNQIPWIDVEYRDPSSGEQRLDSFADSNPDQATATYTRIFEMLDGSFDRTGSESRDDRGPIPPLR